MASKSTVPSKIIKSWLPLAVAITLLCGLLYLGLQQYIRQSANDQPLQMAEDAKIALENGQSPQAVIPTNLVNMTQSLQPYLIIFDEQTEPLASSVQLNSKTPQPPSGVFDFVRLHGEEKFSWQPAAGVRSSAVMLRTSRGYVLAGKSLREVENHENQLSGEVGFGEVATLLLSLVYNSSFGKIGILNSPQ